MHGLLRRDRGRDTVELRVSVAGDPDCDVVIDRIVKTPMGDRCIYFLRTPDGQALRTRAGDDRAFIRAQLRKRTGRIVAPSDDGNKHRGNYGSFGKKCPTVT